MTTVQRAMWSSKHPNCISLTQILRSPFSFRPVCLVVPRKPDKLRPVKRCFVPMHVWNLMHKATYLVLRELQSCAITTVNNSRDVLWIFQPSGVMVFGLVHRYHRFGGAYCLHFQNSDLSSLHCVRRTIPEYYISHQHRHQLRIYMLLQPSFQPRYNSFRKPTINLVTFVCMKQLDSHSADFREIRHWEFLLTYVSRIHFTHRSTNCHVGTSPYTSAWNTANDFNSIWRHEDAIYMEVNRAKTHRHYTEYTTDWRIKNQLDTTNYFIVLLMGSTCFRHYYTHHQDFATMILITTLVISFLVCCGLVVSCG